MSITIILNQDGGTIRGMDARQFGDMVATRLSGTGGDCRVRLVEGRNLVEALDEAANDADTGAIVAGGGDGTISAAAAACFKSGKTLGVLPLGTMNLFARSLGLPLDPADALEALGNAEERQLDIATANGRPFIHQISVGLHAGMVNKRLKLDTSTRLRKISSTIKSLGEVISRPPRFSVDIDTGTGRQRHVVSAISVSNNLFGETPLAYAALLDEGVLGLYRSRAFSSVDVLRQTLNAAIGKIRDDPDMEVDAAQRVWLRFPDPKRGAKAAIDGEIIPLEQEIECICHAGGLRVLVPQSYAAQVRADPTEAS